MSIIRYYGLAKAEAEINAHEQDSASAVSSEIKPLQLKHLLTLLKV